MKILIATSEAVPYIKTGGLADVTGTLVKELTGKNVSARIILPLYRKIRTGFKLKDTGLTVSVPLGPTVVNSRIFSYGDNAFFIECDEFYDRDELYGLPDGDYPDNDRRFIFFSRAVLEAARAMNFKPDIIHCNDWQLGLVPLLIKYLYSTDRFFKDVVSVMTIHNLGYQGLMPPTSIALTGLGWDVFRPEAIEFYGKVNMLKAGIIYADVVTTVSQTYANEILDSRFGFGLDGVLMSRMGNLVGILNGIDYSEWNPSTDKMIPARYDSADISGKRKCRNALIRECGFTRRNAPIAGFVGRLSHQKGVDIFVDVVEEMILSGVNIALLGKGDKELQDSVKAAARKYPGRFFVSLGFDEALAHLVYAGSDMFLMPSRYEPCGLGQMISQRYGTIPIARRTGGLNDTIDDYDHLKGSGTGFLFGDYSGSSLLEAVKRALCVYSDSKKWETAVASAMGKDFSWSASARKYMSLFRKVLKDRRKSRK